MWTSAVTPELLAASVIAVPPLARDSNRTICEVENTKIIRAIEAGGSLRCCMAATPFSITCD